MSVLKEGEKRRIRIGISRRVFDIAKNKTDSGQLFKKIHSDLKQWFKVDSYKDIRREELQSALSYIENWKP